MAISLLAPKRSVTMRGSLGRTILVACCVALFFVAVMRSSSITVPGQLFSKAGLQTARDQKPLDSSHSKGKGAKGQSTGHPAIALNCSVDMPHLQRVKQRYNLNDKFQYMKRYVRFTRTDGLERKKMTKLKQSLLHGSFRTVDVNKQYGEYGCDKPLEVEVPASGFPSTVDASDFLFGVSTTYKRFMDINTTPINEWIFWLTDSHGKSNGGKLVLMLLDGNDEELQEVANLLGDVGIDVDVYHADSSLEMAVRYLSLVPTLYTHEDARKKKWLVTCDDDTFFPSMHGLIDRMRELDHTMDMYVGTLSEDTGALERHGSQAFGGGGVFLSLSLAEKITDQFASCSSEKKVRESDSGWGPQGDIILRKCIYENTETRLTTVWDLWQLDFFGHPAGFYEWGIKPLSLHHYRGGGWHKAKPVQYAKIAHTCGEDCTLQRFQTDDDFILSGYSISHYPEGITFNTNQVEGTLRAAPENKGWNLDFMLGPRRPSLEKTGRKISWEMQESELLGDGSVRQTYTRKQNDERWVHSDGEPMSNIDGVIELVWIPS